MSRDQKSPSIKSDASKSTAKGGGRADVHVVWQDYAVQRSQRSAAKGQKACVLWFTGLSGSGKSTIAGHLDHWLFENGYHSYVLDGDNVRHGLNRDLSFSEADRVENIRRVGETARLMTDAGLILLTAFISPFRADREMVRALFDEGEFIEVFVDTPLEICEQRDPKGLYKKARAGDIPDFTGISSPYERPDHPEIHLHNADLPLDKAVAEMVAGLRSRHILDAADQKG